MSDDARAMGEKWDVMRIVFVPLDAAEAGMEGKYLFESILPNATEEIRKVLSVRRVSEALKMERTCRTYWKGGIHDGKCQEYVSSSISCRGHGLLEIPSEHFQEQEVCPTPFGCEVLPGGMGIPHADLAIYVYVVDCWPSGGTLQAYAATCIRDDMDRPIAGLVSFCRGGIDVDPEELQTEVHTALHEIYHVLGFSFDQIPYYRFPDGTPRTPRDSMGRPIWSGDYQTIASGDGPNRQRAIELGILQVENRTGITTVYLSLPNVIAFVKQNSGCVDAPGAALERTGNSGTVGSHWEDSLHRYELMTRETGQRRTVLSGLTLALMNDTGWYRSDSSSAESLHWGKGTGCTLFERPCVEPKGHGSSAPRSSIPWYFCESDHDQCTYDFQGFGTCNVTDKGLDSPSGGTEAELDLLATLAQSCPAVQEYSNGDCTSTASQEPHRNYLGEAYGSESRCFENALLMNGWMGTRRPGCYERACVLLENSSSYQLYVYLGSETVNCSDGGVYTVKGFQDKFQCPEPALIPRYCEPLRGQQTWAVYTSAEKVRSGSLEVDTFNCMLWVFLAATWLLS